jgi:hypothetical protein
VIIVIKKFIIILSFIYSFIFSCNEDFKAPVITTDVNLPLSVEGCVNVITGNFFLRETDIVDVGYFPLEFQRHYDTGTTFLGEFGLAMGCNFPFQLIHHSSSGVNLDEKYGVSLPYEYIKEGKEPHAILREDVFKHGYIDCLKGPLGAARSPRNIKMYLDVSWNVQLPDGTRREYSGHDMRRQKRGCHNCYLLDKEMSPDNNLTLFTYTQGEVHYSDGKSCISKVEKRNLDQSRVFSRLDFEYGDGYFSLRNSKGQIIKYKLAATEHDKNKMPLIKQVSGDHIINTEYEYQHNIRWGMYIRNFFKYTKVKDLMVDIYK